MDRVGSLVPLPGAERVIDEVISPAAEEVDARGVSRAAIDALAGAGLLGDRLDAPAMREVGELLAAADASTWFCWVQHQSPMRILAEGAPSPAAERWLDELRCGRALGAIAFAHARRPGPPNPIAERVSGGWRLQGSLDWVTSWDIADVAVLQVRVVREGVPQGSYACFAIPAGASGEVLPAGMEVGEPLRLLAMSGTHTRPIGFDGCVLPDSCLAAEFDAVAWHEADDARTPDVNPAAFGLARGALRELDSLARSRRDDAINAIDAIDAACDALAAQVRDLREQAYAIAGDADRRQERLEVRAAALDLAARCATAVVVARAGAGMRRGHSAERRVREAMFLQVQAQTARTRQAQLRALSAQRLGPTSSAGADSAGVPVTRSTQE